MKQSFTRGAVLYLKLVDEIRGRYPEDLSAFITSRSIVGRTSSSYRHNRAKVKLVKIWGRAGVPDTVQYSTVLVRYGTGTVPERS